MSIQKIRLLQRELDEALLEARGMRRTIPEEVERSNDKIRRLRQEISDTITDGAKPCPRCGERPWGMEQPMANRGDGSCEYEIGCLACEPFRHTDMTIRRASVRGGTIPRHAVELWNLGPDAWRHHIPRG